MSKIYNSIILLRNLSCGLIKIPLINPCFLKNMLILAEIVVFVCLFNIIIFFYFFF
jgi:hypothetical protein